MPAHQVAAPFGIPLPTTRDRAAWQRWRQQVQAQIETRHTRLRANTASRGSSGIIETIAGAVPYSTAAKATSVSIGAGGAVVQDAAGNLYIATQDLGVVLKVDSSSSVSVYAGRVLPTGAAEASGDGGPATSARLPWPTGLALDAQGNLYISDLVGATVRVVDAKTGIIRTVAGTPNQSGRTGDGGAATNALLYYPLGIALDGAGNLFINDYNFIREVSLNSGVIQTVAGSHGSAAIHGGLSAARPIRSASICRIRLR